MSLYHYVANKDRTARRDDRRRLRPDRTPVRRYRLDVGDATAAVSAREVLARHPWAIGLMDSRTSPGPRTCATARRSPPVCAGGLLGRHGDPPVGCSTVTSTASFCGRPVCRSTAPTSSATPTGVYLPQLLPTVPLPQATVPPRRRRRRLRPGGEFLFGLDLVLAALEPLRGHRITTQRPKVGAYACRAIALPLVDRLRRKPYAADLGISRRHVPQRSWDFIVSSLRPRRRATSPRLRVDDGGARRPLRELTALNFRATMPRASVPGRSGERPDRVGVVDVDDSTGDQEQLASNLAIASARVGRRRAESVPRRWYTRISEPTTAPPSRSSA